MKEPGTLDTRAQYTLVYRQGRTLVDRLVVMKVAPNGLCLSRYGLSVSKRVGGAVLRNRLKRLLREILRAQLLKPGWDIVFIVRAQAAGAGFHQLQRSVIGLLTQAGLLAGEE